MRKAGLRVKIREMFAVFGRNVPCVFIETLRVGTTHITEPRAEAEGQSAHGPVR